MAVIRNLIVRIGADVSGLGAGTKQAQKELKAAATNMDSSIKSLGKTVAGVTATFAGLAAGAFKLASDWGAASDELITMSNKTGIAVEQLQELQYASNFVDVEVETMTSSMVKLTKNMDNARKGTKDQVAAFDALGIAYQDADGKLLDSKAVWAQAIDALGKIDNETERDAIAMKLFGKSAQELNPLIVAGSDELNRLAAEAHKVGAVMSDEDVEAGGKFDDTMQQLKATFQGVIAKIGAGLIPTVQQVADKLKEVDIDKITDGLKWIFDNGSTLASIAAGIGTAMITWKVAGVVAALVAMIQKWTGVTKTAETAQYALNAAQAANPVGLIITLIAGLIAAIVVLWNTNEDFRNGCIAAWEAVKQFFVGLWDGIKAAFSAVINFIKVNWQALLLMLINPFVGAFKLIYDNCEGFRTFIDGIVKSIQKFFTDLWDGIVNGAKSAINWLIGLFEGFLNIYTSIINFVIKGINKVQFDVPDWVPFIGGKKFGFNIKEVAKIQLPRLANGGLAYAPTMAMVGDNIGSRTDPEVISPLSKLADMLGDRAANVELIIDGEHFGRVVQSTAKRLGRMQGNPRGAMI